MTKNRITTLTGMGIADQVKKAAEDLAKEQKELAYKAVMHAKVYTKIDSFGLPPYWHTQLMTIVNELLGREFMDVETVLTVLETNKPIEAEYILKMRLETLRRNKAERVPSNPDVDADKNSFPDSPVPFPATSEPPVQRSASGLNSRVRTLLGPLLTDPKGATPSSSKIDLNTKPKK